jgi:hypothetical protein
VKEQALIQPVQPHLIPTEQKLLQLTVEVEAEVKQEQVAEHGTEEAEAVVEERTTPKAEKQVELTYSQREEQ